MLPKLQVSGPCFCVSWLSLMAGTMWQIRDTASRAFWPLIPGSGSGMNPESVIKISDHIFDTLVRIFLAKSTSFRFIVNSVLRIRIRDGKIQIQDKHPGPATLGGSISTHVRQWDRQVHGCLKLVHLNIHPFKWEEQGRLVRYIYFILSGMEDWPLRLQYPGCWALSSPGFPPCWGSCRHSCPTQRRTWKWQLESTPSSCSSLPLCYRTAVIIFMISS